MLSLLSVASGKGPAMLCKLQCILYFRKAEFNLNQGQLSVRISSDAFDKERSINFRLASYAQDRELY